jgi:putative sigma-54 modulation protein
MIVQIRAKDITLSDANKAQIESGIEKFKKYSLDITRTNCVVSKEKHGVMVEFEIHVAHTAPVVISERDEELSVAVDIAINRAEKALRRLHDKVTDHKAPSLKDVEVVDA